MLLDTTFFIDLEEELRMAKPGPCASFLRAHRHFQKRVSVISIGEFAVGAPRSGTLRFFRGYERISLGRDLAIFAGRLQANLAFDLGENDLWIGATARFHGFPIVSRDRIFSRIPGLELVGY